MMKIFIWGAGRNCKLIIEAIRKDKCSLIGIIDSDIKLHKKMFDNKWFIYSPEEIIYKAIDYIVISVWDSNGIVQQCREMGFGEEQIIDYWKSDLEYEFIDRNVKKIYLLEKELAECKRCLKNIPYELGQKPTPIIRPAEELLELIIKDRKSLCRFGDGELEIMRKRERPWFQTADDKLARRLAEAFQYRDERLVIGLADNFGSLEKYTEKAADTIREYLDGGTREELMNCVDMNYTYYDAYVTRPYILYKKKDHAKLIFCLFKRIWEKRDVLLVEGRQAYIGIRNDLFEGAGSIRRIIAPSQNAFNEYERILDVTKSHARKETLVLISLGPTATILAYDLAKEGIQALDIGQLDNEYEWYLMGADRRTGIPGKCVSELKEYREIHIIADENYERQIVARV